MPNPKIIFLTGGPDFHPVGQQADAIIAACRAKLGGFKLPKSVEFVDSLPRNAAGKLLKAELREKYWAGRDRKV